MSFFSLRTEAPITSAKRMRARKGHTLIELVIGAAISSIALAGCSLLLIAGMTGWIMGEAKIDSENQAELGIRIISNELRSAMQATVDPNGLGVTYQEPAVDGNGNFVSPLTWDGVNRRIALQGSNLVKIAGNTSYTIVQGVVLTDPLSPGGKGTYQVFTASPGAITRQITMEVVTQRTGAVTNNFSVNSQARDRETIYLRNAPQVQ